MLKHRLISGLTLTGVLALVVFWDHPAAVLLFTLVGTTFMVGGLLEFFKITAAMGIPGFPRVTVSVGVVYYFLLGAMGFLARRGDVVPSWFEHLEPTVFYCLVLALAIAAVRAANLEKGVKSFIASLGGFLYIAWMLSFLLKTYAVGAGSDPNRMLGPYLMFFVIMVTKAGDIGGYTLGKLTAARKQGNHKMVPRLSPKKSWEGFAGSILFSIGIAIAFVAMKEGAIAYQDFMGKKLIANYLIAAIIGIVLASIGLLGDLVESALKRGSSIKDSGSILPGMGGMLDALDSLILIAPLFYLYLLLMGLPL